MSISKNFIEAVISKRKNVNVYLQSGINLKGIILNHDSEGLTLENDESGILVFKSAIASITISQEF